MKVLEVPFNKFTELQKVTNEKYILELSDKKEYKNHLGTVHISTILALAEAISGKFLLDQFKNLKPDFIPIVRKVEVKFSKPTHFSVF